MNANAFCDDKYYVITSYISVGFSYGICVPFCISVLHQLQQHKNEQFMKKRKLTIIFTFCYLILIDILIPPIFLLADICVLKWNLTLLILSSIEIVILLMIWTLLPIRLYLVNFDFQLQKSLLNERWLQELNTIDKSHNSFKFYQKYKHTLGSSKWHLKFFQ